MKNKIIEIQKKAKREIFYLIVEDFKGAKKEIESNYNMGLITFGEHIQQQLATFNKALRQLKENNINDEDLDFL
jgi:hypothetical protein